MESFCRTPKPEEKVKKISTDLPRPAGVLFRILLPKTDLPNLLGDYTEIFNRIAFSQGKRKAHLWLLRQIFRSFPRYFGDGIYWRTIMMKNYIRITLRNFRRHKGYTFINFAGLAIGLAVTLIITFYVMDDLKYDKFHRDADRIYRILSVGVKRGTKNSITAGPLVPAFKEGIPEVEYATRVVFGERMPLGPPGTNFRTADEGSIIRTECILADADFFDVFDFKILGGQSGEALGKPGAVFLTPETAEALFGSRNPIGEPIAVGAFEETSFVAGIVAAPPTTSHIRFGMVCALIPEDNPVWWDNFENLTLMGYVKLAKNADPQAVEAKMVRLAAGTEFPKIFEPRIQPLLDIHLGSANHSYDRLNLGKNDIVVVYTMAVIGILVLLVACINFINLSTSRAGMRAHEVGMRKVVGSNKRQLVAQFLGESVLMTVFTFIAAVAIAQLSLPSLSTILNKQLRLNLEQDFFLLILFFLIALGIGILSGIYPAFVISSFNPVNVLRGELQTGKKGVFMRRTLVVFQFAITTALLVCVFVVLAQIKHLKSVDMGYNREQVLVVFNPVREGVDLLKQRLAALPSVVSSGNMDAQPGPNFNRMEIIPEGFTRPSDITSARFHIDEDLFETLEITILEGRNFSREYPTDLTDGLIVNETLLQRANCTLEDAVGRKIEIVDEEGKLIPKHIVGVIKDFHYSTPRRKSEPMMFLYNPRQAYLLMARIAPGQISRALPAIEKAYKEIHPERRFNPSFLDETFDQQFERDRTFMRNIGIFAGIAIFIACLGLIGLVAFSIEQRRKEIAIRKILGSGEKKIFSLLAVDFLKWVVIANLIAWPCAYFAMSRWLHAFVFRMPFQPWPFLISSAAALCFAFLTISFQTLRATRANPANVLRHEG
jgi:putative ABC transport system permease protein